MNICGELMSRDVPFVTPATTVETVCNLMKLRSMGLVAITENAESRKLLGTISETDVIHKVMAENHPARIMSAAQIMDAVPVVCKESESLDNAIQLMEQNNLLNIVVVNDQTEVVGILSGIDVLATFTNGVNDYVNAKSLEEKFMLPQPTVN